MNVDPDILQQRRNNLTAYANGAPIFRTFGMTLHYDSQGRACIDLPYNPGLNHAMGGIHGGIIGTMLDTVGWFTAAAYYENWIATVEYHVRLFEPVQQDSLHAVGHLIRTGKRLAVVEMEVLSGQGKQVAKASGTFTTTSVPLAFAGQ